MCLAAGSWLFPWVSAQLPSPCLGELALLMLFVLLSMFAQAMSRCTSRGEICGHSRVCHLIRKFDLRRTSEQQTWSDADADFGALKKYSEITLEFLAHLENLSKFLREQYCSLPPIVEAYLLARIFLWSLNTHGRRRRTIAQHGNMIRDLRYNKDMLHLCPYRGD
jgi:hypothetical protein